MAEGILGQGRLGVPTPTLIQYVVRNLNASTQEQREAIQKRTEYNLFSFPASLLVCDFLSCSGTSAMTDVQWASLHRGDESYGRNHGYYALLDAVRDTLERGDAPKNLVYRLLTDETPAADLALQCTELIEGGLVNGGVAQLSRPNFFITPQGRCAENLLFGTLREVLGEGDFVIPSNGFFDTTEGHAHVHGFEPLNLFAPNFGESFLMDDVGKTNPFKGDMDLCRLQEVIDEHGAERVPLIILTITNNTAAGQPVSMANIKSVKAIADKHGIPLFFDACRFAENACFIQMFEEGCRGLSIGAICQELFSLVDGCWMSMKKDALANIGGFLCFRDRGVFHTKYCEVAGRDVGVMLKEKQILQYGNDSYGGLSGRDIMACAVGMREGTKRQYLEHRVGQTTKFGLQLARAGLPVILPPGGHAVYLDMNSFFAGGDMEMGDFGGVGFAIELLRCYAIRCCELGPFAFEWDCKNEEQRKGVLNLVRFAIPRNLYNQEHFDYTVAACTDLYRNRHLLPKVVITRGKELHLRHFQSGLEPVYPKADDEILMGKRPSQRIPSVWKDMITASDGSVFVDFGGFRFEELDDITAFRGAVLAVLEELTASGEGGGAQRVVFNTRSLSVNEALADDWKACGAAIREKCGALEEVKAGAGMQQLLKLRSGDTPSARDPLPSPQSCPAAAQPRRTSLEFAPLSRRASTPTSERRRASSAFLP